MKSMDKQMELFADGGLMDEGGMVDEVSGNEVPPGSTREEVRDDIPAQLSEGEFVFPADVVRYFGLEKLMKMRQEAKAGLARMEEMGQMGNSDEATMPDDLPFTIDDLDIEEEDEYNEVQEFAVGGAVQMPGYTGIAGYVQPPATTTGVAPAPVAAASAPAAPVTAYKPPQQALTPVLNVPQTIPTFQGTVGFGPEGVQYETVTYVNEAGQTLVLKKNKQTGQLLDLAGNPATIPEGYKLKGEEEVAPVTTETATVTGQDGGRDDADLDASPTIAFGGSLNKKGSVSNAFKGKFSIDLPGVGILGTAQAMREYMMQAPSALAYGLTGGKFGEQISLKPGQEAIITDIEIPKSMTPGIGVGRPEVLTVGMRLDADTYNKLARGNVTSRTQLARVAKHLKEFYEDPNNKGMLVDVDQRMLDQITQIDEARKGLRSNDSFISITDRDSDGNSFTTEVSRDIAEKVSQGVDLEAAAWESGFDTGRDNNDGQSDNASDDEAGDTGIGGDSVSSDNDTTSVSSDNYDNDGWGDFNKGGLVKQMKQSGLASKK